MKSWIDTRKIVVIPACAATAALLVMTALAWSQEGMASAELLTPDVVVPALPVCILAALFAGILAVVKIPGRPWSVIRNVLVIALTPVLEVLLVQNFTQNPLGPKGIYPLMLLCNCALYVLFFLALAAAAGSWRIGYTIATVVMMIVGIANYFVMEFRSSPIVPWDLFSIRTALSVADNFSYTLSWRFVLTMAGFVLILVLLWKNTWRIHPVPVRLILGLVSAGLLVWSVAALQKKEVKDALGMDQTLFTPTVRYRNNGFAAAFLGNLHLINVQTPDGYSVKRVEEIAAEIRGEEGVELETEPAGPGATSAAGAAGSGDTEYPDIIVIVDEAFSDLMVRGKFEVSEDYMPFFRSMMREQIGGHIMVSVKGGNTANSEYEFLSGDTMAFLPAGSVVYQQFIRDNTPALPAQLASLGYATTGLHPYLASGWDRTRVYDLLGFEQFLSISDFQDPKYIRDYISDESAFDKILEVLEKADPEEPQFIFEVTMQNHSGYSKEFPGFSEKIHITSLTWQNTQTAAVEKYLTLIYETDLALKKLITELEKSDRPTVVVVFGDHQPSDYITNVIDKLTHLDPNSTNLAEAQKAFMVPYFIWSNRELDMEKRDLVSLNYLASDLLESLGMPMTDYQKYLTRLQKQLPVICAGAYVDSQGRYHSFDEKDEENEKALNTYQILQYNHMTDISHRVWDVFTLH